MKCSKCKTELFSRDVVERRSEWFTPGVSYTVWDVAWRCPKCFKVHREDKR